MMSANDHQVGGNHYRKVPGEQHWDRVYRLFGPGYFIGCATKYVERYKDKAGKQDLEKAIHFIQKLIELEYPEVTLARPGPADPTDPANREQLLGKAIGNPNVRLCDASDQNRAGQTTFAKYEAGASAFMHNNDYLCEGGYGSGLNLYTCKRCRGKVTARGLADAADHHDGLCPRVRVDMP